MKIILLVIILSLHSVSFAIDSITSISLNSTITENTQLYSEGEADLWIKFDDWQNVRGDLNLRVVGPNSKINVAQLKFTIPDIDLVVGRQQLGWGVAYALNPVDIINPKPIGSSFDPAFVRDGRDALVFTRYLGSSGKLELVYAGKLWAAKLKGQLMEADFAFMYINKGQRNYGLVVEPKDRVVGFEVIGTLPLIEWGYWIEAVRYLDARAAEVVLGMDYYWDDYRLTLESYYNGFGSPNKLAYNPALLLQGRLMGQDYFIPSFNWAVNEKLNLTAFGLLNINDSSLAIGGVSDYFINDNLEFIFTTAIVAGDATSEYGMQKALFGNYAAQAIIKWVF